MEAPKMAALEVENSTWLTFVASIGIPLVTQTHAEFDVGNFTTLLRLPGLGLGIKHGNNPHSQEANHLWMGMRKYIWNTHLHHITSTSNRQGRLGRVRILYHWVATRFDKHQHPKIQKAISPPKISKISLGKTLPLDGTLKHHGPWF
jgi:hypothetical protein